MNKYKRFSKAHIHVKWNACGRKKSYGTREDSIQKGQESYECFYCGKWHRTSVSKGKRGKLKGFSFSSM